MHPASRRQITLMLDIFGLAPEVTAFDLGCLNHETGRMSFRNTWTAPQVRKALGWIAARNASGSSCFIRPAQAIAETRWVLVDGLTLAMLNRLTASHAPSMVVRTVVDGLPGLVEARTERVDATTRLDVARSLTRESGGDPRTRSTGRSSAACPARPTATPSPGARRTVRCSWSCAPLSTDGRQSSTSARCDADPTASATEEERMTRRSAGKEDIAMPGNRDFAIACRLLEDGADDHTIAAAIAAVRGFDPKCLEWLSSPNHRCRAPAYTDKEAVMRVDPSTVASWGSTGGPAGARSDARAPASDRAFMASFHVGRRRDTKEHG